MNELLAWDPILWTARVFVLIVLAGGSFVTLLYLARFFRPKHIWRLITGDLPEFREVGGSAKAFGQEIAVKGTLDNEQDRQIRAMGEQVARLEERLGSLVQAVEYITDGVDDASPRQLTEGEGSPGEGSGKPG